MLQNIEKQFDSGERKLVQKSDIEAINRIQYLIRGEDRPLVGDGPDWIREESPTSQELENLRNGFMPLARDDSDVFNFDNVLKGFGGQQAAEKLKNWLLSLEKLKYLIMLDISRIQYSLGCKKEAMYILLQQEASRPALLEK